MVDVNQYRSLGDSMANHDGGKGDKQIPPQNREQFEANWDAIFRKGIPTLPELEEQRKKAQDERK